MSTKPTKVAASTTTAPVNKFVHNALVEAGKTPTDKLAEQVTKFVKSSVIECKTQIARVKTSAIPTKMLELEGAEEVLVAAEEAYEQSRFAFSSEGFAGYLDARNSSKRAIDTAQSTINVIVEELDELNEELAAFEEALADLTATV